MATTKESLVLELVGVDRTQKAHDSAKAGIRSHAKEAERLIKKLKEENATLGMGKKALLEYKMAQMGATAAEKEQIRALQASIDAKKRATGVSQGLNQQLRFMRGGFGQVGHQIQDVVVQAQMGTDAMLILGQQGSQVASLFGAQGAMIGALIAVGAAFSTYITAQGGGASKQLEELREKAEEAAESTRNLANETRAYLLLELQADLQKETESLEKLEKRQQSLSKQVQQFSDAEGAKNAQMKNSRSVLGDVLIATQGNEEALAKLAPKLKEAQDEQVRNNEAVRQAKERTDQLNASIAALQAGMNPYLTSVKDLVSELEEEVAVLGKSAREIDIRKATMAGATAEQIRAINSAYDAIEAYEKEEEALQDLIKAEQKRREDALDEDFTKQSKVFDQLEALEDSFKTEIEMIAQHEAEKNAIVKAAQDIGLLNDEQAAALRVKIAEETQQAMLASAMLSAQSVINSTKSQVDTLRGFFDEASGIGKAFFLVSQAMAAADAVIKGFQQASAIRVAYANMAAMAGPGAPAILAAGEAHAAMAIGMGIATAGAIAGQTIASFEGGGITFNGARSGGLDGKGGRMAMVHPNEKITDMEKGGEAMAVNVNFNIQANDSRGFDELLVKRRAMIVNMVNKAVNNRGRRSLT